MYCMFIYRKLVEETGLWNQIRIDHGREWYLMLFAQQHLSSYRNDTSKPPFVQTTSKKVLNNKLICLKFDLFKVESHGRKNLG